VICPDAKKFGGARNTLEFLSLCQESLDPFNFEPPEPGCIGPLLHRFTVGRVFCVQPQPPVLVLPSCPECGLKLSAALLSGRGHHRGVYYFRWGVRRRRGARTASCTGLSRLSGSRRTHRAFGREDNIMLRYAGASIRASRESRRFWYAFGIATFRFCKPHPPSSQTGCFGERARLREDSREPQ
jgi:hypothetical protein